MSVQARTGPTARMSVDEFLAWAEGRPGRYELVDGEVFAMPPDRIRHAETKLATYQGLGASIRAAGLPCRGLPDGVRLRIDACASFEPDALVYRGQRLDPDATAVPKPIVIDAHRPVRRPDARSPRSHPRRGGPVPGAPFPKP